MPSREGERRRRHRLVEVRRALGSELRRLRLDAGLPLWRVATAAGVSRSHLCEIELATAEPSLQVLVGLSDALGVDLSVRLYPTTGPRIRDDVQARIVEELLRLAHPAWRRLVEVPVYRPARGIIDVVLQDPRTSLVVAVEVHSQIRRLEQQLGWAALKAESLPSAEFWRVTEGTPGIGRLLVLRSTRATRELAIGFHETLRTRYPARAGAIHAALVSDAPWPGSGLLWADVDADQVRILDRPPRNVLLGR